MVEILVAQTLDDLDERRVDVPTALRAIAYATWSAGAAGASTAPEA